ncbi:hypothetical protein [Paraburkholderia lycopersici]|uniref:Uncharacterized protein n=1 Tax=Paraburkholderia lycopersici TaxID=416944 RepID=A0A1G7CE11_9BURK|nr:hypothetical protein [Paraburkholderia lycopersici]SDE37612.1 hypothetical protein SAMN05421548_14444 [Paraburkholderia lycopersici]
MDRLLSFYPDTQIVRISAEGCRCVEQMRWLFGWQALLDVVSNVEELAGASHSHALQYETGTAS